MPVEKSVLAIWSLSFLTFLAILTDFSIVSYWIREGPDFILRPYLIGDVINKYVGGGTVFSYLCISLTATLIFLGLTCFIIYEPPPDWTMVKMLGEVQVSQGKISEAILEKMQELDRKFSTIEEKITRDHKKVNPEFLKNIRTDLEDAKRDTLAMLQKEEDKIRKEILSEFDKQRETIRTFEKLSRQNAAVIKMEKAELETIKAELEKIGERVMTPQPILTSQDNIEKIKGIGRRLFERFKNLGITNVGELIMTNPAVIREKASISQKMAERFKAIAQLLMISTVDEKAAEMLYEAGITSRQELADQNLAQLSRKIGEIARIYIEEKKISKDENPTIEEISSWIRMAKYS